MEKQEFKEARKKLGLSQRALAIILNSNHRTVQRWEDGEDSRPVNPIAARVLDWLLKGFRPPEWPKKKD